MQASIHYIETQTLGPCWVWMIYIGASIVLLLLLIRRLNKMSMKARPGTFGWLLLLGMLITSNAFFGAFLMMLRLETEITPTGIKTRIFPLEFQYHEIFWEDVDRYEIRTFSPFLDYGWGIGGFGSRNASLILWGDTGLQLHAKNGFTLLIGTQEPERLEAALAGK